jgi:hypothetical protein
MKFGLTSSQEIIAKLYRDLRLSDSHYITFMIEWMGEAIDLIGAYPARQKNVVVLDVEMHRAELPRFSAILQVAVKEAERLCPLRYNASTFPRHLHDVECPNIGADHSEGYILNAGYIETTFEEGQVYVSYLSLPVDESGFPMVPDNQSWREGMLWYIQMKMALGGWQHPAGLNYMQVEERWLKYCTQARHASLMPDMEEMENFKNNWVKLVPDFYKSKRMFDDLCNSYPDYVTAQGITTPAFHTPGPFPEDSPSPSPS